MHERKATWGYTLLGYFLIFLALVLIALAIGAAVYWFVIIPGRLKNVSSYEIEKWIWLVVYTPTIFWWAIKNSRSHLQERVFWIAIGGLLALHSVCAWIAFRNFEHWIPFYAFLAITVEGAIFIALLDSAMRRFGHPSKPRRE